MGLIKAAGAVINGTKADFNTRAARANACANCSLKDSLGDKLFRNTRVLGLTCGRAYNPLTDMKRDDKKEGCGCALEVKWRVVEEKCPNGLW